MSSILNYLIAPKNYEIVRDKIGTILSEELANQFSTFNVAEAKVKVTVEGDKIVDTVEMSTIIVALNEGDFDSMHRGTVRGSDRFNVDVFCAAKSTDSVDGAVKASFKLQRIAGMIHSILQSPYYETLGFAPDLISRVMVSKIKIGDPKHNDALCTIAGRIFVDVVVNEDTPLATPIAINGNTTTVNLGNTQQGYQFNTTVTP